VIFLGSLGLILKKSLQQKRLVNILVPEKFLEFFKNVGIFFKKDFFFKRTSLRKFSILCKTNKIVS